MLSRPLIGSFCVSNTMTTFLERGLGVPTRQCPGRRHLPLRVGGSWRAAPGCVLVA